MGPSPEAGCKAQFAMSTCFHAYCRAISPWPTQRRLPVMKVTQRRTTSICQPGGHPCTVCMAEEDGKTISRRTAAIAAGIFAALSATQAESANAFGFQKDLKKGRRAEIPESQYKDGPQGLKYYDVSVGSGPVATEGARVAVHYDARWRGVTFMTSRQGMGVTGGEPVGFDVGAKGAGGTLLGLDLGVRGMRPGGQRKLIVPPELAYGSKGVMEIPPNATLNMDVQLLTIKTSPFGYRTKLVEG